MNTILAINEIEYINNINSGKMISVFFPEDCLNNCYFCTTKYLYKGNINKNKVKKQLINIANSDIEEVIFTGGDPIINLHLLEEYINIVKNKKIFINTCFNINVTDFVNLVNKYDCIKGVNISRHSVTDVSGINSIKQINCNVRINIVGYNIEEIPLYVKNWENIKEDLNITFREDYRRINITNLHSFDSDTLKFLTSKYKYYSQVYCHVCNKYMFLSDNNLLIRYHRGLSNTRINLGTLIEIQEFVLFPDGKLCTDWDYTEDGLLEISNELNLKLET